MLGILCCVVCHDILSEWTCNVPALCRVLVPGLCGSTAPYPLLTVMWCVQLSPSPTCLTVPGLVARATSYKGNAV